MESSKAIIVTITLKEIIEDYLGLDHKDLHRYHTEDLLDWYKSSDKLVLEMRK
jgi:hypothetical protein